MTDEVFSKQGLLKRQIEKKLNQAKAHFEPPCYYWFHMGGYFYKVSQMKEQWCFHLEIQSMDYNKAYEHMMIADGTLESVFKLIEEFALRQLEKEDVSD